MAPSDAVFDGVESQSPERRSAFFTWLRSDSPRCGARLAQGGRICDYWPKMPNETGEVIDEIRKELVAIRMDLSEIQGPACQYPNNIPAGLHAGGVHRCV